MAERIVITLDQLQQLQHTHRMTVPDEYLDRMGHMNIRWYIAIFDTGIWNYFSWLGMDEAYYTRNNAGSFALRQHISYLAEVRAGETLSVYSRLVARSEKRIQFINFMWNETTGVLASTLEALGTHTDMTVRRSAPFLPELAAKLDAELARTNALGWQPPLCGILSP